MNFFSSQVLLLSILFCICQPARCKPHHLPAATKPAEAEFYYVETEYDWNGDGRPDHFRLRVQKEPDPIIEGLGETTKNQRWLYHCWLVVESGFDNSTLWEDEWSVKESEMRSFRELLNFGWSGDFFQKWFTWKLGGEHDHDPNLNYFAVRQLEDREVSQDVLASEMKRLKIEGITAEGLKQEIVEARSSRIFVYRGSNREDIRWATYIPRLRKVIMFQHGFAD